jgi:hypothetical protein
LGFGLLLHLATTLHSAQAWHLGLALHADCPQAEQLLMPFSPLTPAPASTSATAFEYGGFKEAFFGSAAVVAAHVAHVFEIFVPFSIPRHCSDVPHKSALAHLEG